MKKQFLTAAVLVLALGMTACSSKSSEETTPAATEVQAETTEEATEAETEEEAEEDYFYGYVTEVTDTTVTVQDDEGKTAVFDYSGAEFSDDRVLGVGDEVEITFLGQMAEDVTDATFIDIITSAAEEAEEAAAENEDQTVTGMIEKAEDGTMTLNCDGEVYTFDTSIAQKVTVNGIQAGVEAEVTYYGYLDEEEELPMATRIVTEDAYDTEEASEYTLTGTVVDVATDRIVLETADADQSLFTFGGSEGMFDGIEKGSTATVIYEGTLTGKVITALGVK